MSVYRLQSYCPVLHKYSANDPSFDGYITLVTFDDDDAYIVPDSNARELAIHRMNRKSESKRGSYRVLDASDAVVAEVVH